MFSRRSDTAVPAMCSGRALTPRTLQNPWSVKEAWEAAKKRAGVKWLSRSKAHGSEPDDAGVPISKVAKIVGWSAATMVRMAARYGHFSLDDLRGAVESISRPAIQEGSPVNPPGIGEITLRNVN